MTDFGAVVAELRLFHHDAAADAVEALVAENAKLRTNMGVMASLNRALEEERDLARIERDRARMEAEQQVRDYWDACGELIDNHNSAKLAFDRIAVLVGGDKTDD